MSLRSSSENTDDIVEVNLTPNEEHFFQLLLDMKQDVVWVNRTSNGLIPGTLENIKMYYSDIEAFHILESLVRKGMLDKISNGIVQLCPSCGAHESSILLSCPACSSVKLNQRNRIVHTKCDHWGTYEEFSHGNMIKCPLCEEEIGVEEILEKNSSFKYSDPYYECQNCGFNSNRVLNTFLCNACKQQFDTSKAASLEQTGYRINAEPVETPNPVNVDKKPVHEIIVEQLRAKAPSEQIEIVEKQEIVIPNNSQPIKTISEALPQEIPEIIQSKQEETNPEIIEESNEEEDEQIKILLVEEDQMFYNLIIETLGNTDIPIEVTYSEDGAYALKLLRVRYDFIILDTKLSSIDIEFMLNEMTKWKIMTPMVLIDGANLGHLTRKLNIVSSMKRKQKDLKKLQNILYELF